MTYLAPSCRPSSLRRAFVLGFVASVSVMPLGVAFAQAPSIPHVRVTHDAVTIKPFTNTNKGEITTASSGTLLEVLYVEGDVYTHPDTNWYWVQLPPDPWGTRHPGWISGHDVEYIPPPPVAAVRAAPAREVVRVEAPPVATAPASAPARVAVDTAKPSQPIAEKPAAAAAPVSDVVLHFEFGKSNLTDEARGQLMTAVASLKTNESVSFALEGHADWVGTEKFNGRLGLARAETVKQFLCDQFNVPTDKISVVSYGENKPAASNATPEGRALNRRVLIKVGK